MGGRFFGAIDSWFRQYECGDLATYRRVYAVLALVLFWGRATWTIDYPSEFWLPILGFARLLDGPPPGVVIWLLNVALAAALVLLFIGWQVPAASIMTTGLMIALNTVAYSFGKIDHDILMVLAPALLAFSWGRAAHNRAHGLALFAIIIGIGMWTAGWPKLASGWLLLDTQAVEGVCLGFWNRDDRRTVVYLLAVHQPWWLWELHDWLTVILELGFIVTVLRRRWFELACCIGCLFHLGILFAIDLAFPSNVLAYAAFFPLTRIARLWWWLIPLSAVLSLVLFDWHGSQLWAARAVTIAGGIGAVVYAFGIIRG